MLGPGFVVGTTAASLAEKSAATEGWTDSPQRQEETKKGDFDRQGVRLTGWRKPQEEDERRPAPVLSPGL